MSVLIERVLRVSKLFSDVGDRLLESFAQNAVRRRFERGEHIWYAQQAPTAVTIIASGLVKICQIGQGGNNTIVALFGPHESIGDIAVFSGSVYPADAVAASDEVELVCIEKTPVLAAMERDLRVAAAVNRSIIEHSQALQYKIRILSAGSVAQRLATVLLYLAERFGDELQDGTEIVPVVLARAELACLVGATVETTIRIMSQWQKANWVSTTAEGFTLHNRLKLEALTAMECGPAFS